MVGIRVNGQADGLTTVEEYLVAEKERERRHEFVDGSIFEREDATRRHSSINLNIAYYLDAAVEASNCWVFMSMVRLRAASNVVYYPDVMVTCDLEGDDEYIVTRPCAIVEVVSPSTEMTDLREKAMIYRTIPSMRTLMLVYEERRKVIHYNRSEDGDWTRQVLTDGAIEIPCLGIDLSLEQIYRRLPD